jgi:hypothetical protein
MGGRLIVKITMTSLYADILPSENGKLANMIRKVG